jgi:hypothetical protein
MIKGDPPTRRLVELAVLSFPSRLKNPSETINTDGLISRRVCPVGSVIQVNSSRCDPVRRENLPSCAEIRAEPMPANYANLLSFLHFARAILTCFDMRASHGLGMPCCLKLLYVSYVFLDSLETKTDHFVMNLSRKWQAFGISIKPVRRDGKNLGGFFGGQ